MIENIKYFDGITILAGVRPGGEVRNMTTGTSNKDLNMNDGAGILEALRGEFPSPEDFEARVRADYDPNYICFFGLGTAAAGWIRHWCTDKGVEVPPEDVREDLASRLLGWA